MTDNEIIKGLLGCINGRCERCFFFDESDKVTSCEEVGIKYALDLINRQKAEIKRYREHIELLDIEHEAIKISAIKEFAERLKDSMDIYELDDVLFYEQVDRYIDNLVKEMVGEG